MRWPLDKFIITQRFGENPTYYGQGGHPGIDLAAPKDTPIKSPVTGTVIGDGEDSNYIGGKYVIVRDDKSPHYEFYMGHMNNNSVVNGQHVKEGEQIGRVGKTGDATGYHVHFQIRLQNGGLLINPESLKYSDTINNVTDKQAHDLGVAAFRTIYHREPKSSKSAIGMGRKFADKKGKVTPDTVKVALANEMKTTEWKELNKKIKG